MNIPSNGDFLELPVAIPSEKVVEKGILRTGEPPHGDGAPFSGGAICAVVKESV